MWNIDLKAQTATHSSGFSIKDSGNDNWVTISKIKNPILLEEGKRWFLHEYSRNYIRRLDLSYIEIAHFTQKQINSENGESFGYTEVTADYLENLMKDEEPLFPIELCSLIRKAIYFQCN